MTKSQPYPCQWPGLATLVVPSKFSSALEYQLAWLHAITLVKTAHFFFLDDDDTLAANYLDLLSRGAGAGAVLTTFDEHWAVDDEIHRSEQYTTARHLQKPMIVHHAALWETATAMQAAALIERGHYWPEMQLAWEVAKLGKTAYIPEVLYHWNSSEAGAHRNHWVLLSQVNTRSMLATNNV